MCEDKDKTIIKLIQERDAVIKTVKLIYDVIWGEDGFISSARKLTGNNLPWPAADVAEMEAKFWITKQISDENYNTDFFRWAKLSELKEGDSIRVIGAKCTNPLEEFVLKESQSDGLYIRCRMGEHFLTSFLKNKSDDTLIGIIKI